MLQRPFPTEPSLNPRKYVAEYGTSGLAELMRQRAGYVPQTRPLVDFAEALMCGKPLLCMGDPGCGKTAFGKALRYALNVPFFYLQCREDLTNDEVLYYFTDKSKPRTRDNLILADIPAAYEYCVLNEDIPVLEIDEIDKTKVGTEYKLLEILECRQVTVPNLLPESVLGIPDGSYHLGPIIIITANNERELSDPTIDRCQFTHFKNPTPAEEVAILRARVPSVTEGLLRQHVKMIHYIRGIGTVTRKPGIRPSISLLSSLVRKGVAELTAEVIDSHLGHIAKTPGDVDNIMLKYGQLAKIINLEHEDIDRDVAAAFSGEVSMLAQVAEI